MAKLILHPEGQSPDSIALRRLIENAERPPVERWEKAFEMMALAALFKKDSFQTLPKAKNLVTIFEEHVVRFLKLLIKNEVKYILVGGIAVNYHGYARSTSDIDVWLEDSPENRQRLVNTLSEFGIQSAAVFLTHPLIAGYSEILLGDGIYVDFMSGMTVLKPDQFPECFQLADKFRLDESTEVNVLSIHKLIEEKKKSGRAKDLDDAEKLSAIANAK